MSHIHSQIHKPLAPPPPPRGRRPLLPSVYLSPLASSSLSAGGDLPRRGSSTQVGELLHLDATAWSASRRAPPPDLRTLIPTLKVAAVTHRPPRTVSFKVALKVVAVMRHGAEMTRRPPGWMVDECRLP
jgi:hypothetical protein